MPGLCLLAGDGTRNRKHVFPGSVRILLNRKSEAKAVIEKAAGDHVPSRGTCTVFCVCQV